MGDRMREERDEEEGEEDEGGVVTFDFDFYVTWQPFVCDIELHCAANTAATHKMITLMIYFSTTVAAAPMDLSADHPAVVLHHRPEGATFEGIEVFLQAFSLVSVDVLIHSIVPSSAPLLLSKRTWRGSKAYA